MDHVSVCEVGKGQKLHCNEMTAIPLSCLALMLSPEDDTYKYGPALEMLGLRILQNGAKYQSKLQCTFYPKHTFNSQNIQTREMEVLHFQHFCY